MLCKRGRERTPTSVDSTGYCRSCSAVAKKAVARKHQLKHCYGMTEAEYNDLFKAQGGRCRICGHHASELSRRLDLDHCHISGKIRALLCSGCNRGLGDFKDSPDMLVKAATYLRSYL